MQPGIHYDSGIVHIMINVSTKPSIRTSFAKETVSLLTVTRSDDLITEILLTIWPLVPRGLHFTLPAAAAAADGRIARTSASIWKIKIWQMKVRVWVSERVNVTLTAWTEVVHRHRLSITGAAAASADCVFRG